MAGDWMKFDKATPDKPEVFAIASDLGIDPDAVVGKLMRVWSWFDTHTESGNASSVTPALLDRIAGVTGFVSSMQKSGWMVVENGGCHLPNFGKHCGETAKTRAQNNKRVSDLRARNASSVTDACTREEKRREEKKEQKKGATALDPLHEITPQVAADFRKLRQAKKAAITQTAVDGIRREAGKAGMTLEAALAMCCERGWASFKADWLDKSGDAPARSRIDL